MDRLTVMKEERRFLREYIDNLSNEIEEKNVTSIISEIIIKDKAERLFKLEENIKYRLLEGNLEEQMDRQKWIEEINMAEKFREKYLQVLEYIKVKDGPQGSSLARQKRMKLPEIQLQKFDGETKNWLTFWSQFRKIADDPQIEEEDKLEYLKQATTGKARTLVDSSPMASNSFTRVLSLLKERFAKDEMLIEYHMRELINIMLEQAVIKKKKQLCELYDAISQQLNALGILNMTSDSYAVMLLPMLESSVPANILIEWERCKNKSSSNSDGKKVNNLSNFMEFLRCEVESEERVKFAQKSISDIQRDVSGGDFVSSNNDVPTASSLVTNNKLTSHSGSERERVVCIFCEKFHASQDCSKGSTLNLKDKREIIIKNKRCFSCLKKYHSAKQCRFPPRCIICSRFHYAIICPDLPHHKKNEEGKNTKSRKDSNATKHGPIVQTNFNSMSNVYLQTLVVKVVNPMDVSKSVKVRVLLDSGSTKSFVLSSIVKQLGLPLVSKCTMNHALFGGMITRQSHNEHRVILKNIFDDSDDVEATVFTQDKICNLVNRVGDGELINKLRESNILLSDCCDRQAYSEEIGILLGADIISTILTGKIFKVGKTTCIDTQLGWTILGENNALGTSSKSFNLKNVTFVSNLWDLEAIGITDPGKTIVRKEKEEKILKDFLKTITVNSEGRYEVRLPWAEEEMVLGDNRKTADKRLKSTTNKLNKLSKWEDYDKEFMYWLENGIIEKVDDNEVEVLSTHYLPHSPVFKESSATTKIRPVFDASCKDEAGSSLNSCLEKGPNLLELIPDLLIKLRLGEIGVTSDIAKAFLQISISVEDRDKLRFLWWKDSSSQTIQVYRHARVVFGLSSSPFLLMATIHHHLSRVKGRLKNTANKLAKSFYCDNSITAVNSKDDLFKFMTESQKIMKTGKFDLREWAHTKLPLSEFQCCKDNSCIMNRDKMGSFSVLGIVWDTIKDTLACDLKFLNNSKRTDKLVTRRTVLSVTQSVFDPLGMLGPVMITPKIVLQESWKLRLNWDVKLPNNLEKTFLDWQSKLEILKHFTIPRCVIDSRVNVKYSLHIFCDASKVAYGTCAYLRREYSDAIEVSFIQAKNRISPLKETLTIPRLELLACLIGVRLSVSILESLKDNIKSLDKYFWTDSMVCMGWFSQNHNWTVFVRNRVREILTNSKLSEWCHLPGVENPADILSRGCSAKILCESKWINGPEWLKMDRSKWPVLRVSEEAVNVECVKEVLVMSGVIQTGLFDKYSSYHKTVRIVGWIFKFCELTKDVGRQKEREKVELADLRLSAEDVRRAEVKLLEYVQAVSLKKDSLTNFQTVVDENKLIRVKSRLGNANFEAEFTCPVILPNKDCQVKNLLREIHLKNCHAGVQTMLSIVRERFWLLKSRQTIKKIVRECFVCRRYSCKSVQTTEPQLPVDRIVGKGVFETCGIDLGGPLILKGGVSTWFVLFTCCVFRAVHLELVESLSTEAFIRALRRFIARRGRIKIIYCDNGTNFTGAMNRLNEIDWDKVEGHSSTELIRFKFNVPSAPWWGGFYERLIRVVKDLLRKVLGRTKVNYEELYTVLCDVEAVVNARPLTYVAEEDCLKALTPADFLLTSKYGLETKDLDFVDSNGLKQKAKYLQELRDQLRNRFRKEYLGLLVHRRQCIKGTDVKEGDIVLLEIDNHKRILWPIGRIIEVMQGSDGVVRAVKVKTRNSELWRPVQKVYLLEMNENELRPSEADNIQLDNPVDEPREIPEPKEVSGKVQEEVKRSRYGRILKPPDRFGF